MKFTGPPHITDEERDQAMSQPIRYPLKFRATDPNGNTIERNRWGGPERCHLAFHSHDQGKTWDVIAYVTTPEGAEEAGRIWAERWGGQYQTAHAEVITPGDINP